MNAAGAYNYESFSFALEAPELDRWLRDGPHVGELAPDFTLEDLDHAPVRLSMLHGRPVVLEFGSYSCPIFSDRVPAMERLAVEHPEGRFLVIAVRGAHPGEVSGHHRTLTQKRQAARQLAIEEGIQRPVLVDDVQGSVHRAYGGAWNPVYMIDPDGRVADRRAWNHPDEVAHALGALADGHSSPEGESVEMARLPGRVAIGLRLLERGARRALLDFYRTAPQPVRARLRESSSQAVRAVIE